ncbi:hypothetical protein BDA99DRAFT_517810, partial [Phascolomyces articulosus]
MSRLLLRLVTKYAQASNTCDSPITNNNDTATSLKTKASLNWIKLRYCSELVTDEVLLSLSSIKTLHDIHLGGLRNISINNMIQMFNILGNQVTRVFLHDMDLVNDNVMAALGDLDNLYLVKLELLHTVTDQGIQTLVDKKTGAPQKLVTLEVTECNLITENCIQYTRERIKTVRFNSPYSEYYITKAKKGYYVSRSPWN